ncbi:uncharacterized protein KD926_006358 [Aspergillus affinis]|uniref:uncharacterized protein n=1 Tax=Aspergillus affinis TaxID=1070780 RepID=UPI0022FE67C4|nr:uncharacterized protein KD926_006358 [Aspergillus affinis]KAI9041814.1 hypothetical protein KD926_006358 [Aspergillus affinis]
MPRLPNELIIHVIRCLIPPSPPVAFPSGHIVTRTLVSLILASRLTRAVAIRLLFRHCLYLDSGKRLHELIQTDKNWVRDDNTGGHGALRQSQSLFLRPFPADTLEEPQIVKEVDQVSLALANTLRRLVIDMPLRLLYPEEDHSGLRRILRHAFGRLTALEEFCSVRDELFCDTLETWSEPDAASEPEVWSGWPRLRCLALYNPCINDAFVRALQRCPSLTHLALTRSDGLTEPLSLSSSRGLALPSLQRVIVINTCQGHRVEWERREPGWETSIWARLLPSHTSPSAPSSQNPPQLVYAFVSVPRNRGDEDIELCQEWVCEHAVNGTLWDIPGTPWQVEDP